MRIRFPFLSAVISALVVTTCAAFTQQAIAMQITFTQTPPQPAAQSGQSRNQTKPQEGLSPEKKNSLSKYGPDDLFPAAREQEKERGRNTQPLQMAPSSSISQSGPKFGPASGRSKGKAVTAPAPVVTPSTTPVTTPTPTAVSAQTAMTTPDAAARQTAPTPSPTINVGAVGQRTPPAPLAQQSALFPVGVKWNVPILSGMAVAVFAALVYVLFKLREKIRVGSGG